jgi:hypothetical protein
MDDARTMEVMTWVPATGALSEVPQARLAILPATSHISISGEEQVLEPLITAFLDDVAPANSSLR